MTIWQDQPILLYGPIKSGTTLLLNLFDGEDDGFIIPTEVKWKFFLKHIHNDKIDHDSFYEYDGLPTYFAKNHPNNIYKQPVPQQSPSTIKNTLTRYVDNYLHCIDRKEEQQHYFMKEAGSGANCSDNVMSAFLEIFPQGKVVWISRNPAMVASSIFRDRRKRNKTKGFLFCVSESIEALRINLAKKRWKNHHRVCCISYEELVTQTEPSMQHICANLDIIYSPVMSKPTYLGQPVIVSTASEQTTEVFVSKKSWWQGLTLKEIMAIISGYSIFLALYPLFLWRIWKF